MGLLDELKAQEGLTPPAEDTSVGSRSNALIEQLKTGQAEGTARKQRVESGIEATLTEKLRNLNSSYAELALGTVGGVGGFIYGGPAGGIAGGTAGAAMGAAIDEGVKNLPQPLRAPAQMAMGNPLGMVLEPLAEGEEEARRERGIAEPPQGAFDPENTRQGYGEATLRGAQEGFKAEVVGAGLGAAGHALRKGADALPTSVNATDARDIAQRYGMEGDIPAWEQTQATVPQSISHNIPDLNTAGRKQLEKVYKRARTRINDQLDESLNAIAGRTDLDDMTFSQMVVDKIEDARVALKKPISDRYKDVALDMSENGYLVDVVQIIKEVADRPYWKAVGRNNKVRQELDFMLEQGGVVPMEDVQGLITRISEEVDILPTSEQGFAAAISGNLKDRIKDELKMVGREDLIAERADLAKLSKELHDVFGNKYIRMITKEQRPTLIAHEIFGTQKNNVQRGKAFMDVINAMPDPDAAELLLNDVRRNAWDIAIRGADDVADLGKLKYQAKSEKRLTKWFDGLGKEQRQLLAPTPERYNELKDMVTLIDELEPSKMLKRYAGAGQDLVQRAGQGQLLKAGLSVGAMALGGGGGTLAGGMAGGAAGVAAGALFGFWTPAIIGHLASSKTGTRLLSASLKDLSRSVANGTMTAKDIAAFGSRVTSAYERVQRETKTYIPSPPDVQYEGAL